MRRILGIVALGSALFALPVSVRADGDLRARAARHATLALDVKEAHAILDPIE